MPLMFYSMSLDAVVVLDLCEDPTLTMPMRLREDGVLFVKGQFIEETRSYIVIPIIPPIPPPTGSITYDDYDSYTAESLLHGLNSGSNEWDNTTPLAAYFTMNAYVGIKEWDDFNSYESGSSLSSSLVGSGSGDWNGVYDYYGVEAYVGIKVTDYFSTYETGSSVSGSDGGLNALNGYWNGPWFTREQNFLYGIKVYDDFSTYTPDTPISGSDGYPYEKWNNTWVGPWDVRLNVSGSL